MLGIIIGVGAVITMVAVGRGATSQVEGIMASFGENLIIVMPAPPNSSGARGAAGSGMSLTLGDSDALANDTFSILRTAPEVNTSAQLVYGNNNWSTSITGSTPDILPIRMMQIEEGVCFSESEVRSGAKVCVIGRTVAKELFGYSNPLDATIRIRNIPFRVVGILKSKGANSFGADQDDVVFVPITTAQRRLVRMGSRVDTVRRINVQAKSRQLLDTAKEEVKTLLRQRHKIPEGTEDDFDIRDLTANLENMANMASVMSLLLGSIASISLLVGGIGIMNIMLVSVSERTREIGIRMAVGARPSNVRVQFLTEAVVLSILGGAIGISIGFGVAAVIAKFFNWPASVSMESVILAVGFSGFVGIFFGFWPAWKASNLDPIVALRTD
ncbi:MAG: ABC transporter permease [Synergistaceae bacterium]|nr:ABC transporter permease [Synergistaceae bacterium]MBQ3449824.1 ABC transporter permease [Synergistaceae bacterium]MBQ3694555.1 ABC transporter permease [Synergistaceae bacterium]MBR0250338.1 ABC transporter permease [Synergistaceae bacterium]